MHDYINKLARLSALLGGIVLIVLIGLTCFSILGRSLNSVLHNDFFQTHLPGFANLLLATGIGPINGDFELVEAGMAFSIFAFLPLCQLLGGHACVTIVTDNFSNQTNHRIIMLVEILFAATFVLLTWQLFLGMESKRSSGQTSFLIQFPVWWAYAPSLLASIIVSIVASYMASIRILEWATDKKILPEHPDASH